MIVTCERCETQFQLDESRVPAAGARVRCSRCKHAFMVTPPSPSPDEAIHAAAESAAAFGGTPDVTDDLPDEGSPAEAGAASPATSDENEDSDWQFAEEGPAASPFAASEVESSSDPGHDPGGEEEASLFGAEGTGDDDPFAASGDVDVSSDDDPFAADASAEEASPFGADDDPFAGASEESAPEESPFGDAYGDESLDLASDDERASVNAAAGEVEADADPLASALASAESIGDEADGADTGLAPEGSETAAPTSTGSTTDSLPDSSDDWDIFDDLTAPGSGDSLQADLGSDAPTGSVVEEAPVAAEASGDETRTRVPGSSGGAVWLGRAQAGVGWLAVMGLLAVGLARGLDPVPEAPPRFATPAGLAVEQVSVRWIENAHVGRLYVVSGRLSHEGSGAAQIPDLELAVQGRDGLFLPSTWRLDAPRSDTELRESRGRTLEAQRMGFRRPLQPGETRDFQAIAWPLPATAERFEIRARSTGSS